MNGSTKRVRQSKLVVFFDVDNTLLNNDRISADLNAHLKREVGPQRSRFYWAIFEKLRGQLGYADYLGALQGFRRDFPHDLELLWVPRFLIDYPFSKRLYARSLDVIRHFKRLARVVLLSDGDVVFQPHKVERSGLYRAVDGQALIYVHKERELADVEARFPAAHYVVVDDKLRILAAIKKVWKSRVTTVFVRQGHYALDPEITARYPSADETVQNIGDLLKLNLRTFRPRRLRND